MEWINIALNARSTLAAYRAHDISVSHCRRASNWNESLETYEEVVLQNFKTLSGLHVRAGCFTPYQELGMPPQLNHKPWKSIPYIPEAIETVLWLEVVILRTNHVTLDSTVGSRARWSFSLQSRSKIIIHNSSFFEVGWFKTPARCCCIMHNMKAR